MSSDYSPGWHPQGTKNGFIVVAAWQGAQFGPRDPDTRRRPKLIEQRDIVVRRYVSEESIGTPEVLWGDGCSVRTYERAGFSKKLQKRIKWAIEETRRISGAR